MIKKIAIICAKKMFRNIMSPLVSAISELQGIFSGLVK